MLSAGRVTVNGSVAALGGKADPDIDSIYVDGKPLRMPTIHTYIMLHKPRGYVSTLSDEKGRKTVVQLVSSCPARVWPVGRLDMDSEGLLLLTDDGKLTHRLTHPSNEIRKEYCVHVDGSVTRALPILAEPMMIDGERMVADEVRQVGEQKIVIVIHQGKNRQVRRMCAAAGLTVNRLIRIKEHGLHLDDLPYGKWRYLTDAEVTLLKR